MRGRIRGRMGPSAQVWERGPERRGGGLARRRVLDVAQDRDVAARSFDERISDHGSVTSAPKRVESSVG
jgi:hypothetical protein